MVEQVPGGTEPLRESKRKHKPASPGGSGVLSRFTRRVAFDHLIFSWVNCTKHILPSVMVVDAIRAAMKFYGIQELYKEDAAIRSYYRLYDEWMEEQKSGYGTVSMTNNQ